jgi:guanylate kinase
MLFLMLGPSGVGKGTQIKLLKERHPEYVFPQSVTTRKMRPGESDGNPYFFISQEAFDQHVENGDFLEWAEVHKTARYGTLLEPIEKALSEEKTIFKELDIQGLIQIHSTIEKEGYESIKKNLRSIFIMPPSIDTLVERITERAPIKEIELQSRLESAEKEMRQAGICSKIIETEEDDSVEDVHKKLINAITEASEA